MLVLKEFMNLLLFIINDIYAYDVYDAIKEVESGGDCKAIGDSGKAVGAYQIHEIYVKDANRISGKSYTLEDRYDEKKSLEIVKIVTTYYGNYYKKKTGKEVTPEIIARIHNGGALGWNKSSTISYWNKVKSKLIERTTNTK